MLRKQEDRNTGKTSFIINISNTLCLSFAGEKFHMLEKKNPLKSSSYGIFAECFDLLSPKLCDFDRNSILGKENQPFIFNSILFIGNFFSNCTS